MNVFVKTYKDGAHTHINVLIMSARASCWRVSLHSVRRDQGGIFKSVRKAPSLLLSRQFVFPGAVIYGNTLNV